LPALAGTLHVLLDKTLVGCGVTDKVLRTVTNVLENEITVEVRAADNKLHIFAVIGVMDLGVRA
jgi:hypothetical protein